MPQFSQSIESIGSIQQTINPLPDDKILDWSKLKQIAFKMKNKCYIG